MFDLIEEKFATAGLTPKGRKALRAIFRATHHVVTREGLHQASLDAIADRAGLTQAALRYHFPTRDDLFTAFFASATQWFQAQMATLLENGQPAPRDVLERCVGWHLEFMEAVDTAIWLEASTYWLRQAAPRKTRDDWYRWLCGQYAALIARMQPGLGPRECQRRGYALLTLVLGAWVTHGRGSSVNDSLGITERRQLLIDAALDIATQ